MKVNCWNEYDKLKTVILGSVYDIDNVLPVYEGKDQESFVKINEQTHYELLEFQKILEQHGVTVLRPKQPTMHHEVGYANYQAPLINMRDFHMAYGNLFFLTYGSFSNRRNQHAWIEDIANSFIDNDNFVLSANEFNYFNDDKFLETTEMEDHFVKTYTKQYKGKNLYHCASILKHNKKALASKVAGTNIGTKWIKKWLNSIGVDYIENDYIGHIDGAHSILNKNLLMASYHSPLMQHFEDFIKVPVVQEYINWFDDVEMQNKVANPTGWLYECQGYFQQFCAEANSLSINPETVCLSFYDKDFYNLLKNKGVNAIYVPWKNRYFWGGGLHCITLDIEREHES